MRIVLATSAFGRDGGGVSAYNREAYAILTSAGHEVRVFTAEQTLPANPCLGEKVTVKHYPLTPQETDQTIIVHQMFDEIIAFNPDVLISSDSVWLTSLFPCFADRRIRISICHTSGHEIDSAIGNAAVCRATSTDWLIALSEAANSWLIGKYALDPKQIKVIYNTLADCPSDVKALIEKKCLDERLLVVFPGGSSEIKAADVVLKTLKYLINDGINCDLVWFGKTKFIAKFLPRTISIPVFLHGLMSRKEAVDTITGAHCILLPSRGEGCPMTLLEAMRSGTIPIVSDCPSAMREIVKDGLSGFIIRVGDEKGIAHALENLSTSADLRKTMMLSARDTYEKMLSPEIWLHKMEELINKRRFDRNKGHQVDMYNPQMLIPWHRPKMSWKQPSINYLKDRIRLFKHAGRCSIISLALRLKHIRM